MSEYFTGKPDWYQSLRSDFINFLRICLQSSLNLLRRISFFINPLITLLSICKYFFSTFQEQTSKSIKEMPLSWLMDQNPKIYLFLSHNCLHHEVTPTYKFNYHEKRSKSSLQDWSTSLVSILLKAYQEW